MDLRSFVLCNAVGDEVCISNFGARLLQWHTEVDGADRNIILGYSSLSGYQDDPFYLGAIIGPYANRIANACFSIDGKEHALTANDGLHHMNGGNHSLSDLCWELVAQEEQVLTLKCELEDGFNGYPGGSIFWVTYHLNNDSSLDIDIKATTEQVTAIGPTCHPYFNLAGVEADANGHTLQIFSDNATELNEKGLPTGELMPVEEGALDFRKPRQLNNELAQDELDDNFIVNRPVDESQAILISPDKKLQLHVSSGYPSLLVNTGQALGGKLEAKSGICIAPQFYPNSPNISTFPFYFTTPERPLTVRLTYRLVKPHCQSSKANKSDQEEHQSIDSES